MATQPKYTQGPWSVIKDAANPANVRITSAAKPHIAKVYGWEGSDGIRDANADLIAAAPVLHDALAACVKRILDRQSMRAGMPGHDNEMLALELEAMLAELEDIAEPAFATARGEATS